MEELKVYVEFAEEQGASIDDVFDAWNRNKEKLHRSYVKSKLSLQNAWIKDGINYIIDVDGRIEGMISFEKEEKDVVFMKAAIQEEVEYISERLKGILEITKIDEEEETIFATLKKT